MFQQAMSKCVVVHVATKEMPGSREVAVTCFNMLHIAALSQHTSTEWCKHRSLANTQTNEMARSCTAEQKPEPKNLILLLLCNANLKNPPKTVKFLSAPLTRHPSRHMQSCFPGRLPSHPWHSPKNHHALTIWGMQTFHRNWQMGAVEVCMCLGEGKALAARRWEGQS